MSETLEQFKDVGKQALADLGAIKNSQDLEQYRIKYLSRKGEVTQLLGGLGKIPKELRAEAGKLANQVKNEVNQAFQKLQEDLKKSTAPVRKKPFFDVSLPGKEHPLGARKSRMSIITSSP